MSPMTGAELKALACELKEKIVSFEREHGVRVGGYSDRCGKIVLDLCPDAQDPDDYQYVEVGKFDG